MIRLKKPPLSFGMIDWITRAFRAIACCAQQLKIVGPIRATLRERADVIYLSRFFLNRFATRRFGASVPLKNSDPLDVIRGPMTFGGGLLQFRSLCGGIGYDERHIHLTLPLSSSTAFNNAPMMSPRMSESCPVTCTSMLTLLE